MNFRISGVELPLGEPEPSLGRAAAHALGVPEETVSRWRVLRRAVDARRSGPPRFAYVLEVTVPDDLPVTPAGGGGVTVAPAVPEAAPPVVPAAVRRGPRPVVVGTGPAGLFAALTLAMSGVPPLIVERGRPVEERVTDVRHFWEAGVLDPESHVHFGEGGAGAFSDGKLTSRAKNPDTLWVKRVLADSGAPSAILTDAKPHIGTDRLRSVLVSLRKQLLERGCEIRFRTALTDLFVRRGNLDRVILSGEEEIPADALVLAAGQSAPEVYRLLRRCGARLEPKPFAVGLRVQHPQEWIDRIQYGRWAGHPDLPPAEYFLAVKTPGGDRSVYTFCMCPGGEIIGCSSEAGGVVTNGMSAWRRDGPWANSAVVVNVRTEDFREFGAGPLAGLAFRRFWEERAFRLGGGGFFAPAQRLTDFLEDGPAEEIGAVTYRPGVRAAPLREALPSFAVQAIREGIRLFERKMRGFVSAEAVLVGVETRTSSPVRIVRDDSGQCVGLGGIYPCGEGSGYAGGIISSALDGIRAARRLLAKRTG
jgi:uncharacterized FAD-dependent dehydrogenase